MFGEDSRGLPNLDSNHEPARIVIENMLAGQVRSPPADPFTAVDDEKSPPANLHDDPSVKRSADERATGSEEVLIEKEAEEKADVAIVSNNAVCSISL